MDYILFWINGLKRAFDISKGVVEMLGFVVLLVVGFGGWALVKKRWPSIVERIGKVPGLQDETRRNASLFGILFVVYVIAVGPYSMYKEQAEKVKAFEKQPRERFDVADVEGRRRQDALEKQISSLTNDLVRLAAEKVEVQFQAVVLSAKNDDKEALNMLLSIARVPSHLKAREANDEANEILIGLSMPRERFIGAYSVSPKPTTIESVKETYRSVPRIWKPAALDFFYRRPEYKLSEKLEFFAGVIQSERSSEATWMAMQLFKDATGQEFGFLETQKYVDWLAANKHAIGTK